MTDIIWICVDCGKAYTDDGLNELNGKCVCGCEGFTIKVLNRFREESL
jgi:predicted  nucleic acid-binding Zn-ribbon protein